MTTPTRTDAGGSAAWSITYWFSILGIYTLLAVVFFKSGWDKLFVDDGNAPAALAEQFAATFLDTFPGVDAAWVILGILELVVVALLVVSLVTLELLPSRRKPWLLAAVGVSLLTFALLSFGQTTLGNHEGTASLYTYFAGTAIIFWLVDRLSPGGRS